MASVNKVISACQSWVESANDPLCGFPIQNLPYCAFETRDGVHLGIGIGDSVIDLYGLSAAGHLASLSSSVQSACLGPVLNVLLECGPEAWVELREALIFLLSAGAPLSVQDAVSRFLTPMETVRFVAAVKVGDYTDFYASIEHATNVGRLFRPDQPLLPNYKHIPIAYHGRASSLILSGTPITRPHGQVKTQDSDQPVFRPSAQLDYELEVAAYIGRGNPLGTPIPARHAEDHLFGFSLLNDWSARDIQSWEYQPLGPFLGKNFGSSLSPWVVTRQALLPFRVPRAPRGQNDPSPLAYLDDSKLGCGPAIDMTLEVYLSSERMRAQSVSPQRLSRSNLRELYWSFAQMIAHHTANGCNLTAGDLLGSGTVSGATPDSEGSLLESTRRGQAPVELANSETRTFLEDGDEIILRGFCEREGLPRISLGECRGIVHPAILFP